MGQCNGGACASRGTSELEPLTAAGDAGTIPLRWPPRDSRDAQYKYTPLQRPTGRSGHCLRVCLCSAALYGLLVLAASLSTMGMAAPMICAIEEQSLGSSLDLPLRTGTPANLAKASQGMFADVDLTGIWQMTPGEPSCWAMMWWRLQRTEVLLSFAGSHAAGDMLHVPAQQDRQWGYSNSIASLIQMFFHSISWGPQDSLDLVFVNSSYAYGGDFGVLARQTANEWRRSFWMFGHEFTYKLTRVVYARGGIWTTHPVWWPNLLKSMSGYSLRWWGDDNLCRRRCETGARILLFPGWSACRLCAAVC